MRKGAKLMANDDKSQQPPSLRKDETRAQKLLSFLRKHLRTVIRITTVVISAAFVVVAVFIYEWFSFIWPSWVLILLIIIGFVLLILLIRVGYTAQWTGFKGKAIWSWLNLFAILLIPLVVVGATIGFGGWQAHLAELQHTNDLNIAHDQQQETTLKSYLHDMSDLLLNHNLRNSTPAHPVRQVAKERTLTTLRRLGADRNKSVL
jgi:hypothetical protein